MLTLEIYGKFITWPDAFAQLMMKHYREHQVPFIVHRNCVHTGWNTSEEKTFMNTKYAKVADVREGLCYCHQLA